MSTTWKIINISVFSVWMALLSFMLYREYAGTPLENRQALKGSFSKATHWYDIYSGTKKIGFASSTFERVGEETVIRYQQEVKIRAGEAEELLIESYRCVSNSSFAIKSFEYSSHIKNKKGLKVTGDVGSDAVVFFLESAEKRKTYRMSTEGREIYLPITFIPAIILKRPVPDSVYTVSVLNMNRLSIDDVRIVVEEIRPVKVGRQLVSYYKVRSGNDVLWSNDKGITQKEEFSGLTLYSQTETMAKDPNDRILFDPLLLPLLRSGKVLRDTENLKSLKVRIRGFPLTAALYDRSTVTLKNDTLTILKESPEELKRGTYSLPGKHQSVSRYLMSDEWVLSEDETVKGNALNMASLENDDAFSLVRYLNSNLYFTVKTMLLFRLLDSRDLFKSPLGDYLQRTVMFASFARAAGIPTRIVGGFVYLDGYFCFHTWPEVWFDKWIPMEPTLAQFPADVTHIPLVEGTLRDITSITDSLRSVNIEVLEAS